MINPLTTNAYTVNNSAEFVNEISTLKFDAPVTMASFDVESLFTNIPLKETTKLILDNSNDCMISSYGLDKPSFASLLEIATCSSMFTFKDKLFTQIDGVAMGSPLGPSYANAFLCYHEQSWLDLCPLDFKPIFYRRYVDDTFLIFKDPSHIPKFSNYLNSKHPNIKFTYEVEKDKELPFLDVLIKNDFTNLSTSVYRKLTFTGLGINFRSFIPYIYKINSIKTLLHRAYSTCSTWLSFHNEASFLGKYFYNNQFPKHIFEKQLNKFLNSKLNPAPLLITVKKDRKYVKIPYLGHSSYDLRKKLSQLLRTCYPQIDFRIVFSNKNTIGNFFKRNNRLPTYLRSNVVYQFTCSSCTDRYVGSTSRWLLHRIREHQGKSTRTGNRIANPSFSAIRDHSHQKDHPFSFADFRILTSCSTYGDLITAESLLIRKLKPCLNASSTAAQLFTQ